MNSLHNDLRVPTCITVFMREKMSYMVQVMIGQLNFLFFCLKLVIIHYHTEESSNFSKLKERGLVRGTA